jgi:hypothetical protein
MRPALKTVAALRATAHFHYSSDKHALMTTIGRFISHYTSMCYTEQDGELLGKPLLLLTMHQNLLLTLTQIRICKPNGTGWSQIDLLSTDCVSDSFTFSP